MTPQTAAALRALVSEIRERANRPVNDSIAHIAYNWCADSIEIVAKQLAAESTISDLADRFLGWPLPESVNPDLCVHTKGEERAHYRPIGTHLLTHSEACAMLEYVLKPDGRGKTPAQCPKHESANNAGVATGSRNDSARESDPGRPSDLTELAAVLTQEGAAECGVFMPCEPTKEILAAMTDGWSCGGDPRGEYHNRYRQMLSVASKAPRNCAKLRNELDRYISNTDAMRAPVNQMRETAKLIAEAGRVVKPINERAAQETLPPVGTKFDAPAEPRAASDELATFAANLAANQRVPDEVDAIVNANIDKLLGEPRAAEGAGMELPEDVERALEHISGGNSTYVRIIRDYIAEIQPTAAAAVPAGGDAVARQARVARNAYGKPLPYKEETWFTVGMSEEKLPHDTGEYDYRLLYTAPAPRGGVTEDVVRELAQWLAERDGCDDVHQLIYEGHPPEPWGEVWNKYEDNAKDVLEKVFAIATPPAAQAQDAGPMARHWRIAITDYFRLAIKITEGSLCDWIEQRARALAAKEAK